MSGQTVGRLWSRYLELRKEISEGAHEGEGRREAERRVAQLRDRLVVNYSPMVKYVASRVGARMTAAVELEDMISWGVLGLLDAIETYDPGRRKRAKSETYASSKIRWTILDGLRGQEVERFTQKLSQDLLRPPTEGEITDKVGVGVGEYRGFLDKYSRVQEVASLEARPATEGGAIGEYGSVLWWTPPPRTRGARAAGTPRRHLLLLRRAHPEGDRQSHGSH